MADNRPLPPMAPKTVWLYIYSDKNDYDGPAFLVFAKKEAAVAHAADAVKDLAQAEKTNFVWEEGDEQPERLDEILKLISDGKLEDAVDEWEDYRSWFDGDESVTVQEVPFLD